MRDGEGLFQGVNAAGIELIKSWEGIEDGNPATVNLDPYLCPGGYWTIGWGHAIRGRDGKLLYGPSKKAEACAMYPNGITLAEAEALLREDVAIAERAVRRLVDVELTENMFSALVSFVFNVGEGAFADSTLLKRLNAGHYGDVPAQMRRWNKSNGKVLDGLINRREAEIDLWSTW